MPRKRRKRYIIVEASDNLPLEAVKKIIEKSHLELFGEFGLVKAGLRITKQIDDKLIIECLNKSLNEVILSISSITEFDGKPITFRIVRVVGTIKRAREVIVQE
ncbi:MAG: Rpp14/Pop5 family protein [Candidatus Caldarchaeales archaeon]